MKFKRVQVEYTKTIEVTVLCPADMADEAIAKFLHTYDDLDGWDEPDWASLVSQPQIVNIPAEECRVEKNARGRLAPVPELLRDKDLMVISDDRAEMVDPIDATWWICDEEKVREERRNEPNPNQMEMWDAKS